MGRWRGRIAMTHIRPANEIDPRPSYRGRGAQRKAEF
jgi:hypothetical protein